MERLLLFIGALALVLIAVVILAWPLQWLWNNCLVGAVDGVNTITFWQALGLGLLFNILFRSINTSTRD